MSFIVRSRVETNRLFEPNFRVESVQIVCCNVYIN